MSALAFLCAAALVVDGDTLRCANIEAAGGRVRLARIDAAEMSEAGGVEAKRALQALIAGRAVRCLQIDASPFRDGFQATDRYGRIVARCSVAGRDLGAAMIANGFAEQWPK